ncbi:MAG: arsenite methyltransferase [Micromonosporaceae bacterium]|nr:arsenite methyltransferase [Micromonosporaceae bacterium]
MAMNWFWRLVCSPDCTDACQVNCPGCHSLADEWAEQGYTTAVTRPDAKRGRWQDFRYAWSCWSRSASAAVLTRLNPARLWRRDAVQTSVGCGCGPATNAVGVAGSKAGSTPGSGPGSSAGSTAGAGPGDRIRGEVRQYYDLRAHAADAAGAGCCPTALPTEVSCLPQYRADDLEAVPADAIVASLGCGNPFARADLRPGEVVLDLGSGGGMDSLVAARRVGAEGHVFGLDMSDEMMRLAQRNAADSDVTNVAFIKGDMESVPLPRASVDVIISNCVVNLVPDKGRALREAYRVLRPGGRVSISDIVTRVVVPEHLKNDLTAWAACVGGALREDEYRAHLEAAGFVDIEIERDREYTARDAELAGLMPVLERAGLAGVLELGFANTSVRAHKPTDRPAEASPRISGDRRSAVTVGAGPYRQEANQ